MRLISLSVRNEVVKASRKLWKKDQNGAEEIPWNSGYCCVIGHLVMCDDGLS